MYRAVLKPYGLTDEDCESRGMGQQGVDIILSPAARSYLNHSIECKKHKRVVVPKLFEEHYDKYKYDASLKLLFHSNDRAEALVTMRAEDFMSILSELVLTRDQQENEYVRIA